NTGNIRKSTVTGAGGISSNDVVVLNSSAQAVDTTAARDTRVFGVSASTCIATATCAIIVSGNATVNADASSTAINIGDQLVTSTSSGRVIADNNATTGILGTALSALASGTGTVSVYIRPAGGASNPNIPGNLTVQGTGTSSFAGAITVSSTINGATL